MRVLERLFPFLAWFPASRETLRADSIAGLSVGLVLVPQSMAYAQLAGLPPHYGLYAAFLPLVVGALWGSSHQLSTGPVAVVALLTGSTLATYAAPGSGQFVAMAVALALLVGAMQLALGLARLGAIVNFVSHPVIVGFANAAAIIIALSQLSKLLGVAGSRGEHFLADVWDVLQQAGNAHLPTVTMAAAAAAVILSLRRFAPRVPGILVAVVLATAVSWAIGYEHNTTARASQFADPTARAVVESLLETARRARELGADIAEKTRALQQLRGSVEAEHPRALALRYDIEVLRFEARTVEREHRLRARELRHFTFRRVEGEGPGGARFHLEGLVPAGATTDGYRWRFARLSGEELVLAGGGEVVGSIPAGLPRLSVPALDWELVTLLLSSALAIALVGFMEALSIARAIAGKTRQRIDADRELIGQGLANLAAALSQAFPVSGSFSRSAVNFHAGAATGLSSVFAGLLVMATLLFLTPLLYHLPQSVLAVIVVLAVANLVNPGALRHAWAVHPHDGAACAVTFVATLAFAPHLHVGILVGAGLAIVLYLYRTMRPRVAVLGRHPDGTLRDARLHRLETSPHIVVVRFDGSLIFANVPYFEDAVLGEVAARREAEFVLVVGDGINELDASGEEAIRRVHERLREGGLTLAFSGLKHQVMRVLERTGLEREIGTDNFFRNEEQALAAIRRRIRHPGYDPARCVLSPRSGTRAEQE